MDNITLFGIIMRGGILMIPIIICSVIVIGVAVERWLTYRRAAANSAQLMMRVRHPLSRGDIESAARECAMTPGPVAAVLKAGLEKARQGRDRIREAMEASGNTETYHLEKNLSILATLSGIAPLLGFFGTVTGMIKAFMKIQQLAGNVNADVLAGGIWEAMVTTAAGLAVGIPAVILYNYYVNRVKEFIFQMESAGEEVLDILGRSGSETQPEIHREIPQNKQEEPFPFVDPFRGGRTRLARNPFEDEPGGEIT
ncbi:MAG: MotA/TolQ/ExbB proton channel family protein [Candidatus Latescibacterota bacterium]